MKNFENQGTASICYHGRRLSATVYGELLISIWNTEELSNHVKCVFLL